MLWSFVFGLAPLSLQRLHRTWKQDIHHWAGVWSWQLCPLHLPSGRTQTDPRRLRPRLQHVLCCPWKLHQKPLPIIPHEGEISILLFFIAKPVLEPWDIAVHGNIAINLSILFFNCQTFLKSNVLLMKEKWAFEQQFGKPTGLDNFPEGAVLGLTHFICA